jgi:hypothetical protein
MDDDGSIDFTNEYAEGIRLAAEEHFDARTRWRGAGSAPPPPPWHHARMDRAAVDAWLAGYERVWRTPGTDGLAELFSADVSYWPSPWASPLVGLDALAPWWDTERDGPDEVFTMVARIVAVDGDTAVVRVAVDYGEPVGRWLDLWVLDFDGAGRCRAFEEWPFAPDQPDGHD